MRAPVLLALVFAACAGREQEPPAETHDFDRTIAVYLLADSARLDSMRARYSEDDYYAVADDMMWYRAESIDWLEARGIPVVLLEGRPTLSFRVDDRFVPFEWPAEQTTELVVLYRPGARPVAVAPVEVSLRAADYFGIPDTTVSDTD